MIDGHPVRNAVTIATLVTRPVSTVNACSA
jgi:hypothetical protein